MLLFLGRALAAAINISRPGFNSLTVKQTDLVSIDLVNRVAIFLDVPPHTFSAAYRPIRTAHTNFLSITVPDFSVTGSVITLRCLTTKAKLRFWLIDRDICPDLLNVAKPKTDYLLQVESGVAAPLCLFSSVLGNGYRTAIETGVGLPEMRFFSARGLGKPVKTCRGEADLCIWESYDPFFMWFRGTTKVNMSYQINGVSRGSVHCAIAGIPTIDHSTFVDASPKIDSLDPWCLPKANGLIQAFVVVAALLAVGIALSIFAGMALRKGGLQRCHVDTGGPLCLRVRAVFDECI
jgi:hypothetical protein